MRLAKLLLASSLVASCAFAESEGAFVGIQGGYNFKSKVEDRDGISDISLEDGQGFIGLKGGYDFGSYRPYLQYNYNMSFKDETTDGIDTAEAKFSGHEVLLGIDWTPGLSENFKLAIGPYFGFSLLKVKVTDETGSESKNEKGLIVGGKIGGIYSFGSSELEMGLKADYSWHVDSNDEWVDFDKTTYGAYVGYNLKFN